MDMRTDLIAVPHAGLGFHFLRVQVGKPKEEEEVHPAEVPKVSGKTERAGDKMTTYVQKSQVRHRCISPLLKETTK